MTITDDLTGLFNARHLFEVLEQELECGRSLMHPLTLAFLDLDSFKLVNDAHGHQVGSELLALTGRRLRQLSRKQDCCFRYGGDEFVILMPDTPVDAAFSHIGELNRRLTKSRFCVNSGLTLSVSASIGLANAPLDGASAQSLIGAADARMLKSRAAAVGAFAGQIVDPAGNDCQTTTRSAGTFTAGYQED